MLRHIFAISLALLFGSCRSTGQVENGAYDRMLRTLLSQDVKTISVEELHKEQNNYVIIDARESEEYDVSHLKNALPVGYEEPDYSKLLTLPRDAAIAVYCSVGYRSEKTIKQLEGMGFNEVYNVYGGIFEWKNRGFLVYQKDSPTDSVHAYNKLWGIWLRNGTKVYE